MRDANPIVLLNLAAGHQIRERMDEESFDSALQRAGAIPEVDALSRQELPGTACHIYEKRLSGDSRLNALTAQISLNRASRSE